MRLTQSLAFLSLGVFGSAMAVSHQQEPLAEAQFKNIQSFKGSKASDVIPAMQFMSASLGVGCDYCHTEDRASDDKNPKKTAREMIAMQRDINSRNFNGRNTVTCASCHGGHTRPIAVPPVEGSQIRPRRSVDVKPDEVLATYSKAVGADDAHPIQGLRLSGTNVNRGEKGKVDAIYSGAKFVITIHGSKGDQRVGFNGTMAWFSTPKGIQQVPLVYAIQEVRLNDLYADGKLPILSNMSGATAKLGDRDVLVVNGTIAADKTRVSLYFDKKTGLLARSLFGYPTVLGNIIQTNDYADYRKVNGVELPMTITNHTSEWDSASKFSSVKVETLDAGIFDPPAK